jgi:hypothetical protein
MLASGLRAPVATTLQPLKTLVLIKAWFPAHCHYQVRRIVDRYNIVYTSWIALVWLVHCHSGRRFFSVYGEFATAPCGAVSVTFPSQTMK